MKTTGLNLAKVTLYLFLGLSIVLVSCSGKDGINGETGPQGPAGQDGNANVIVSDWIPFVWSYTDGVDYAWMDIPVEGILDFIESGGVLMLYLRNDYNGTSVRALPIYSSSQSYYFSYGKFGTSFIGIRVFVSHSDLDLLENDPNIRVHYVLVPANVAEASGIMDKSPESFGEAAALLGLEQ